ncbi:ankyrin-1-like [Triticum urartu]|nr:ankyrin-1-like [Triticum urartu]
MQTEPENKMRPSETAPELLMMAAREGDSARLRDLLGNHDATATAVQLVVPMPEVIVNIEENSLAISRVDSILHVVAACGDTAEFLESASLIHSKAKHLLGTGNNKGDTPLHCAAGAGRIKMLSHLIHLAIADGGGDAKVKAVLRKQNNKGETALHEVLRLSDKKMVRGMVEKLMEVDAELARLPIANGTSPLYLAVSLGHDDIAELLYSKDKALSYSGPDGQNVLHVAVLRSQGMTNKLLQWNRDLSKQGDSRNGSTPLHFAASCGFDQAVISLINADKCSAYRPDNKGSFPIHIANKACVIRVLLEKCPNCAELRDAQGRTFLHVVICDKKDTLFRYVFGLFRASHQVWRFASIMDKQDNEGNTGLHLAVLAGRVRTLHCLLWNKEIQLNLPNNDGKTALDLALSKKPTGVHFGLDSWYQIYTLLAAAGAKYGAHLKEHEPQLNEKEEADKINGYIPTIAIVAALLVTVSFTCAFSVPGGYRAGDDQHKAGTPVLSQNYFFLGFIMANNLALLCSGLSLVSLMYAGLTTIDLRIRAKAFILSIVFLNSSARSLTAAFSIGIYAVLAPVDRTYVVVTMAFSTVMLLDIGWFVYMATAAQLVHFNRLGMRACLRFAFTMAATLMVSLWPYAFTIIFLIYSRINGVH